MVSAVCTSLREREKARALVVTRRYLVVYHRKHIASKVDNQHRTNGLEAILLQKEMYNVMVHSCELRNRLPSMI